MFVFKLFGLQIYFRPPESTQEMINLGEYMLNVKNKVFLIIPLSLLYLTDVNSKFLCIRETTFKTGVCVQITF